MFRAHNKKIQKTNDDNESGEGKSGKFNYNERYIASAIVQGASTRIKMKSSAQKR